MNQVFNPAMLKLARESRGLSQNELCLILEVGQGTISKYENAISTPNAELLEKISKSLKYPDTFFCQTSPVYPANLVYYRKRLDISKDILLKAEARMNIARMTLEKMLESVDIPATDIPNWDIESNGSPEQAGQWLRSKWRVPKGKISSPIKLLENHGVIIIPFDFETLKISGLSMFTTNNHPVIFVNRHMPSDRQLLTVYHEFGHIIHHLRSKPSFDRDVEKEAFAFASEFLVPAEEFESSFHHLDINTLSSLKLYWNLSMGALIMKASKCNRITANQEKYLWAQMSRLGYRLKEPSELDPIIEPPSLVQEIVKALLGYYNYTLDQLANVFCINQDDLSSNLGIERPETRVVKLKIAEVKSV